MKKSTDFKKLLKYNWYLQENWNNINISAFNVDILKYIVILFMY